jgi:hypothetical protein
MNFLGSGRCVLIVYTAVVMLAGCGGSQAPMNSTNASPPGAQGRMKMTSSSGCGSVCCPALPGGTGILSDGDFAQATDLGSRWNHVFKGTEFSPHWKVSKRNINFYGSTAWNVDGLCSVDLDGTPGPGGITHSQFQTEKREGYTVAFLFSGNGACESTMKSLLSRQPVNSRPSHGTHPAGMTLKTEIGLRRRFNSLPPTEQRGSCSIAKIALRRTAVLSLPGSL